MKGIIERGERLGGIIECRVMSCICTDFRDHRERDRNLIDQAAKNFARKHSEVLISGSAITDYSPKDNCLDDICLLVPSVSLVDALVNGTQRMTEQLLTFDDFKEWLEKPELPRCDCHVPSLVKECRNGGNEGRRFHNCYYGHCKFFYWID